MRFTGRSPESEREIEGVAGQVKLALANVRTLLCGSLIFEHFCATFHAMKREQFIRQLSKDAKAAGGSLVVDMARGKGGHCVVRFGTAFSIIKSGEITPLMEKIIRKQLGLWA